MARIRIQDENREITDMQEIRAYLARRLAPVRPEDQCELEDASDQIVGSVLER